MWNQVKVKWSKSLRRRRDLSSSKFLTNIFGTTSTRTTTPYFEHSFPLTPSLYIISLSSLHSTFMIASGDKMRRLSTLLLIYDPTLPSLTSLSEPLTESPSQFLLPFLHSFRSSSQTSHEINVCHRTKALQIFWRTTPTPKPSLISLVNKRKPLQILFTELCQSEPILRT